MWNEIINEKDVEYLMFEYGFFHDSCIKEIKYHSGAFVNADLSMMPFDGDNTLHLIIQRQEINPTVIEMEFCEVKELHLIPYGKESDCIILGASLILKDGLFYWGDSENIDSFRAYQGTWICSSKIKWRIVDEYIGNKEVY